MQASLAPDPEVAAMAPIPVPKSSASETTTNKSRQRVRAKAASMAPQAPVGPPRVIENAEPLTRAEINAATAEKISARASEEAFKAAYTQTPAEKKATFTAFEQLNEEQADTELRKHRLVTELNAKMVKYGRDPRIKFHWPAKGYHMGMTARTLEIDKKNLDIMVNSMDMKPVLATLITSSMSWAETMSSSFTDMLRNMGENTKTAVANGMFDDELEEIALEMAQWLELTAKKRVIAKCFFLMFFTLQQNGASVIAKGAGITGVNHIDPESMAGKMQTNPSAKDL